jgi:hypothetical protein
VALLAQLGESWPSDQDARLGRRGFAFAVMYARSTAFMRD